MYFDKATSKSTVKFSKYVLGYQQLLGPAWIIIVILNESIPRIIYDTYVFFSSALGVLEVNKINLHISVILFTESQSVNSDFLLNIVRLLSSIAQLAIRSIFFLLETSNKLTDLSAHIKYIRYSVYFPSFQDNNVCGECWKLFFKMLQSRSSERGESKALRTQRERERD